MDQQQTFFDFAAEVGLTKHIGGIEATETLLQLCNVSKETYVLDVGCGAGVTPVFIAQRYGCKVAAVDILDEMIERSKERAQRAKILDQIDFRVADAQDLPFDDNLFDAVITESVTAFPPDKQKAVNEYYRVLKPGGFVGLNESTWLKVPPPPEMVEWVSQDIGTTVKPLTPTEWIGLLQIAGFKDISQRILDIDIQDEARGILRRYGCGGMLAVYLRIFMLYLRNPAYRKFVREVQKTGIAPPNVKEYFGYGLYTGKK